MPSPLFYTHHLYNNNVACKTEKRATKSKKREKGGNGIVLIEVYFSLKIPSIFPCVKKICKLCVESFSMNWSDLRETEKSFYKESKITLSVGM